MKNKYIAKIYEDCLKDKPIKEIHADLMRMTIKGDKLLLAYMVKLSNKAKKVKADTKEQQAIYLIDLLATNTILKASTAIINHTTQNTLIDEKQNIIDNMIKQGRKDKAIWYVASSHKDSAEDHKDYQGKLYIDENWREYDEDGWIADYVNKHDIRTVQWVMNKPVWFITRPYCRHYFVQYKTSDIMKNRYKIPKRKMGDYNLQTPAGATLEFYEDRLKQFNALYRVKPTKYLKIKIDKTRMLIDNWKKRV